MSEKTFQLEPIGQIQRNENDVCLEIAAPFRPGLKQLDHFSHVIVFWWADQHDTQEYRTLLQTEPPYAQGHVTGVFACRSPYRPNPLAMTTCKILAVADTHGIVRVSNIDAYDGTQIVDLKGYFPVCDRVQNAHIPDWLADWPEWMPEEGMGLEQ